MQKEELVLGSQLVRRLAIVQLRNLVRAAPRRGRRSAEPLASWYAKGDHRRTDAEQEDSGAEKQ